MDTRNAKLCKKETPTKRVGVSENPVFWLNYLPKYLFRRPAKALPWRASSRYLFQNTICMHTILNFNQHIVLLHERTCFFHVFSTQNLNVGKLTNYTKEHTENNLASDVIHRQFRTIVLIQKVQNSFPCNLSTAKFDRPQITTMNQLIHCVLVDFQKLRNFRNGVKYLSSGL